jgi:hypothetical protein
MESGIDLETFDIERFARSIEKDCQEGVKWERRKLEWVREERTKEAKVNGEAA